MQATSRQLGYSIVNNTKRRKGCYDMAKGDFHRVSIDREISLESVMVMVPAVEAVAMAAIEALSLGQLWRKVVLEAPCLVSRFL